MSIVVSSLYSHFTVFVPSVSVIVCVSVSVICLLLDIEVSLCSSVLTQFSSVVALPSRSFDLIVQENLFYLLIKLMIFSHK